jgi:hypothetical protein
MHAHWRTLRFAFDTNAVHDAAGNFLHLVHEFQTQLLGRGQGLIFGSRTGPPRFALELTPTSVPPTSDKVMVTVGIISLLSCFRPSSRLSRR